MMDIVHTPNIVLTTPAREVPTIDQYLLKHIGQMKEVLLQADNPKGVGLAAPQVGSNLRIFMLRPDEKSEIQTCINPSYLSKSQKIVDGIGKGRLEGCLSVPNVWGMVKRHQAIKLRYFDETGKMREEKFLGFPAIIVQHEMDHLDGILFTRRVFEQKGTLYKPVKDEHGKEILEPIEL